MDWSEKLARRLPLTLVAPEPRHAYRRAEFPGLCLLLSRNRKRAIEIRFGFCDVAFRRLKRDLASNSIDLGLKASFLCCFYQSDCFGDAVHSFDEFIGSAPVSSKLARRLGIPLSEL